METLNVRASLFCLMLCVLLPDGQCQFPAVCAKNLTTSLPAVCCPIPDGSTEPCGGPGQGLCREVISVPEDLDLFPIEEQFLLDDRLAWPARFLQAACSCVGNFDGYACHQCKPGWTGEGCLLKRPVRIRRNALSLSAEEQRRFRDRIDLSKRVPMTEWLVLNISDSSNGDPTDLNNIQLIQPPSLYDYYVFIHVYASRSTLAMSDSSLPVCDPTRYKLDFAHKGPAFVTWHRAFMLMWELELGRLGTINSTDPIARRDGDNFPLPYWDWTSNQGCPVCTNNLVGASDPNNQNGRLDSNSPFTDWITYCPQRPGAFDCHVCDPGVQWNNDANNPMAGSTLWRKPNNPQVAPRFSNLPDQTDMDVTLNCVNYDVWPYQNGAGQTSFRDLLEGFTNPKLAVTTTRTPTINERSTLVNENQTANFENNTVFRTTLVPDVNSIPVHMHNLVHSYLNGSWFDVSTSPNDPIFLLHHAFVDKVFELWFRKNRPGPEQYPRRGCPPGHRAYSSLVPFVPLVENIVFFVDSRSLGYDYDNSKAGSTIVVPADSRTVNLASLPDAKETKFDAATIGAIVVAIILVIFIVVVVVLAVRLIYQRRAYYYYYTCIDPPDLSARSQLDALNTWRRTTFNNLADRYRTRPPHHLGDEKARLLDAAE